MGELKFNLSPTQWAFVNSDYEIVQLKGPMGEGKTFAGAAAVVWHAKRLNRGYRGALIRDTHTNMKTSTIPDLKEIFGPRVKFHDDDRKMFIKAGKSVIEFDLFGIDDEASLAKLQGPQYALIWLEEPAPIQEKSNAGLPRAVFEMAVARAARQKGTRMRVQITQNPADEDHWSEELAFEPEIMAEDPETGIQIRKAVFDIPAGENKFLNPHSRVALRAAYAGDEGKFLRYVLGQAAPVLRGAKVTPEYNQEIHLAKTELPVIRAGHGFRFYDAWHSPVCIIGQHLPPGRVIVHDVLVGEQVGIRELIEQQAIPMLRSLKYRGKLDIWRDIGDPSMMTADQSSIKNITSRVVEVLLKARFEPGPTKWAPRINPTRTALSRMIAGVPVVTLSRSASRLHRALRGGWHWKTDNNGKIIGTVPVKDEHSHIGDAFAYGMSVLFPFDVERKTKALVPLTTRQGRARSYCSGGMGRAVPLITGP